MPRASLPSAPAATYAPTTGSSPTVSGFGGYLFSTHPIPLAYAGSFNFTFEIGAGLELFRSTHRSLRVEYNIQHFSNHFTANQNPGVDNGLFKLTYAFGW